MKRNFLLSLTLILITFNLFAQEPGRNTPDIKKISKQLKDPELYSGLLNRYLANDSSLTIADYHLIYYGFSLQKGYDPNKDTRLRDSLNILFMNTGNGESDYRALQSLTNRILVQLPFDIRSLDPAIYASEMLKDNDQAIKLKIKMGRLIETIFNSGDGLTKESPFYVVSVANIPDMVRALGFEAVSTIPEQSGNLFYFKVKENEFGVTGFYFRIFGIK